MSNGIARVGGFAFLYWAIVFGIGVALGILRTLLLEPRIGALPAELVEAPVLIGANFFAAWFLLRREKFSRISHNEALFAGFLAGILLLAVEISLVEIIRGVDFATYLNKRPQASTILYFALVVVHVLMPWFTRRSGGS